MFLALMECKGKNKDKYMKTIRYNVFETNSSSTHSLTMCKLSEYKNWEEGKLAFDADHDSFITIEECYKDWLENYAEDEFKETTFVQFKEAYELYANADLYDSESENPITHSMLNDWDWCYQYPASKRYGGEEYETFYKTYDTGEGYVVAFGYFGYNG